MFRVENSPEYEAEMEAYRKKRAREERRAEREWDKVIQSGRGQGWTPMEDCPFAALDERYDASGVILVTDGATVTVARIARRFGRPLFWKTAPEMVFRDGMMRLIGGEEDPRDDLPKWWWKWEVRDELESETWAHGEPAGQPEVDFVPTYWMFLPAPPAQPKE